jgi:hypothetical protein
MGFKSIAFTFSSVYHGTVEDWKKVVGMDTKEKCLKISSLKCGSKFRDFGRGGKTILKLILEI